MRLSRSACRQLPGLFVMTALFLSAFMLASSGAAVAQKNFWAPGWSARVSELLAKRGFSPAQIRKFTAGPISFNTETGEPLPDDAAGFARALPDCYAQDERTCTFRYSANQSGYRFDHNEPWKACLVPARTRAFCQRVGFLNWYRRPNSDHPPEVRKQFQASCWETPRGWGCGADLPVFDGGKKAQSKLKFDVRKAEQAHRNPAAGQDAFPVIVYHSKKYPLFSSRQGPPRLEEWEVDPTAFIAAGDANQDRLIRTTYREAMRYCWPHDVFHPCDVP